MIHAKIFLPALILVVLSILFSERLSGQESDANIWTRFALKYDLDKNTRLAVEEEFRFFDNATRLDQNHTEIGLTRELSKRFEGGIFYRFIFETDESRYYSTGHRGWLQLEYLLLDTDLKMAVRNRTQASYYDIFSSENGKSPEWYNRYKLSIDYRAGKSSWIPNGGIEFWHFLNPGGNSIIDKFRISAGIQYRFSKHWRWDFFYAYQQQIQVNNPRTDHIAGVACTWLIN